MNILERGYFLSDCDVETKSILVDTIPVLSNN